MKMSFCLFFCAVTCLYAAEIPVEGGIFKAKLDTRGGALTELQLRGKLLTQKRASMTDRLIANRQNGNSREVPMEFFRDLEYKLISNKTVGAKTDITFQVRGIGAFNWLRMTKTYHFVKNSLRIRVDYQLENLDKQPHYAGIWTQTSLRYCGTGTSPEINTIWQPSGKTVHEFDHPGKGISMDEWSLEPSHAFLAIGSKKAQTGIAVLLPADRIHGYYCWFDLQKGGSTLEWMLRQQKIAPGAKIAFTVELNMTNKLSQTVKSLANRKLAPVLNGDKLWITDLYAKGDKNVRAVQTPGKSNQSEKFMNVSVLRQYQDSIRGIRLPGTVDPAMIRVCEINNGQPDETQLVPFHVRKLSNGEYQVLFLVPGFNKRGELWTKIDKDDNVFDGSAYLGKGSYHVQIALDRAPAKTFDASMFEGGADLLYNGNFSKKASYGDWPDGFYWSWSARNRNWYQFKDGVMRVCRPDKSWATFWFSHRVKSGEKLTFRCRLRNDDRVNGLARVVLDFYDKDGKVAPKSSRMVYNSKESHDWRTLTHTFYVPEKAVIMRPKVQLFGIKDQYVYIDDFQVVPEDLRYIQQSKQERLRDQTKNLWYKPLDFIEKISHDVVTPHTKWMKPSAFTMPEVLFLPFLRGEFESPVRRTIVELTQRMDFSYRYIPLLARVLNIAHSSMGVYGSECAPELEAYTIECLKNLKTVPKVIIIQGLDFKKNVKAPFLNWLTSVQKKGASVLFVNCFNIPAEFLGKKIVTPQEMLLIPIMRNLPPARMADFLTCYDNGNTRNAVMRYTMTDYYTPSIYTPASLSEQTGEMFPAYFSREYPYWEFNYLTMLKALRWLAKTETDAGFKAFAADSGRIKFRIHAKKQIKADLEITYTDLHRQTLGRTVQPLTLQSGEHEYAVKVPRLQGGLLTVQYRLLNQQKKVMDSGASRLDLPEVAPLKLTFASESGTFKRGEKVSFTVHASNPSAGNTLRLRVEDCEDRIVYTESRRIAENNTFSITLNSPYAKLYRVMVEQVAADGVVSAQYGEFALTGKKFDTTDLTAMVWHGRPEFMKPLKDLGYDLTVCPFPHFGRVVKNHANLNMETLAVGASVEKNVLVYRGDKKSDPVRNPCYSDPARTQEVKALFEKQADAAKWQYYSLSHYFLGDEMFLGSTVCYSPHCLKDFREVLKKQYGSLQALNAGWETSFTTWDQVVPCQLEELKNQKNLSRWLDHKLFMAGVFAGKNVGTVRSLLNNIVPDVRCGISGTQLPGYSYDWAQLMKHINFIAYYSGVQIKLVHDFGGPELLSGRWGCGYVDSSIRRDQYQNVVLWQDLFQGANMAANYATGSTFQGDLTPNYNIAEYSKVMRELKRGLTKMTLTARPADQRVAVLYSQPSLFAAMGTIGRSEWMNAYSGWNTLLEELHINFRFISYEDLTKGIDSRQYKVLILPCAIALSPVQTAKMEQFVRNGGTVIADFVPGCFDEHGKRYDNKKLAALFGISSTDVDFQFTGKMLKIAENKKHGVPAVSGEFRIGTPAHPVMKVNPYGKGKAVLMNIMVNGYQTVALSGVGGEVATQVSGSAVFCRNMRNIAGGILKSSGVIGRCQVKTAKGADYPCQTMLRNVGDNYVFGIMKDTEIGNTFDMNQGVDVTVTLPVKGHVYNVREKKYLGNTSTIKMRLVPAWGYLYTILKHKITGVKVNVSATVERGSVLTADFRAVAESGKPGLMTFHVELIRPDGKVAEVYRKNLTAEDGAGTYTVQTAFNDPAGRWRIRVTNVNTGLTGEKVFVLK